MTASYYDPDTYPSEWNFLQSGTILDHYMIEKPIAGGGFSSVYLARQLSDQHQVAIKEYMPRRLAHRTWQNQIVPHSPETRSLFLRGKTLFVEEAKALGKLKHPNIVEVLNFFPANSTIYLVMTYDYGKNLSSYIKDKKGNLTLQFILTVFPALLEGVQTIHEAHLLHLDIKPENILIRPGGDPLLLDFGAVHPFPKTEKWTPGKVLTKGFSPPEQYPVDGNVGPWSDMYAIGATIRTCIEGRPPPPSPDRVNNDTLKPLASTFKRKYPLKLLKMVDASLELDLKNRPQSTIEMMDSISQC